MNRASKPITRKASAPVGLTGRQSRRTRQRAVQLKSLYKASDIGGITHLDSLPGEAPFVRGPYSSMYTGKPWTIRQYAGYAEASDSNLAFRTALEQGAQGLSVAFDLPTQRGYDSNDPQALADVGMAGVAIDTVEDVSRLFQGVPLDRVSVSMTINGAVLPVLAAFIVAAEESGVPAHLLSGTVQNDILKEYAVRNTWIYAPEPSLKIVGDVAAYLAQYAPRFHALSVSGYHFQEAGADPVLELALTFANAREYGRALCRRGLAVDKVCEQLSFFFGVGTDFFVEIAKLRAARMIWSDIADGLGAKSTKARALRMHCQTSGWSLSAHHPENNIVRTTVEAMAAVFGGTQSLHTNAFDEALALPSAPAARLARDTQLILQHEMGLCDVIDPWAGSYMMEKLTAETVAKVSALMREIDLQGGVLATIHSGWVQRRIRDCAARTQAHIDAGRQVIVGENSFGSSNRAAQMPVCLEIDNRHVRALQARRIDDVKRRRDGALVAAALDRLTRAARDGCGNLLALTLECIRSRATIGECVRALEAVWPRYAPAKERISGQYGQQRSDEREWADACDAVRAQSEALGRKPRILVAKLGQDGHDRGANVVAGALSDAGFDVLMGPLFGSVATTADMAIRAGCDAIGISSLTGAHLSLVPQLLDELASRAVSIIVVVGGIVPDSHLPILSDCGVSAVFGPGSRMETVVRQLVALVASNTSRMRRSPRERYEGLHTGAGQGADCA